MFMYTSRQLQQTPHLLSYPFRWSELLTPGPSCLCKEFSQDVRHNLWQNQLWHKRKSAKEVLSESDDEESQQFGIRQEIDNGNDPDASEEEEDADVLPLYGQDDDDFGDSSSEASLLCSRLPMHCNAGHCTQARNAVQRLASMPAAILQCCLAVHTVAEQHHAYKSSMCKG